MDDAALIGMLGLAMRAGQLLVGTGRVVDQLRARGDLVVLMDDGAAQNTQKRVSDVCTTYQKAWLPLPAGLLESALGKPGIMVAGLKPGGIREKIVAGYRVE